VKQGVADLTARFPLYAKRMKRPREPEAMSAD